MNISDNIIFYLETNRFRFLRRKEVIEKVIKEEVFAKEPGLELSGGNVFLLSFVLILCKFRKFPCNLQ